MTFIPASSNGSLAGTAAVTLVAAPAAATQRMVRTINIHNADTVDHTIELRANGTTFMNLSVPSQSTLVYGEGSEIIVLEPGEVIEGLSDAGATTTEPTFVCAYSDLS